MRFRSSWLVALLAALIGLRPQSLDAQTPNEAALKVALIYNFALFVDWPEARAQRDPAFFRICLAGEDGFGTALTALESKTIRGKKVMVQRLHSTNPDESCDVLFLSGSERARLPELAASLSGKSVLTISDADAAARSGAVIGVGIEHEKMVFD